jgi:hypothetical protein
MRPTKSRPEQAKEGGTGVPPVKATRPRNLTDPLPTTPPGGTTFALLAPCSLRPSGHLRCASSAPPGASVVSSAAPATSSTPAPKVGRGPLDPPLFPRHHTTSPGASGGHALPAAPRQITKPLLFTTPPGGTTSVSSAAPATSSTLDPKVGRGPLDPPHFLRHHTTSPGASGGHALPAAPRQITKPLLFTTPPGGTTSVSSAAPATSSTLDPKVGRGPLDPPLFPRHHTTSLGASGGHALPAAPRHFEKTPAQPPWPLSRPPISYLPSSIS